MSQTEPIRTLPFGNRPVTRRNALLIACAALAVLLQGFWWHQGRSVAVVDAPEGKLDCVSYTPPLEQPMTLTTAIEPARIRSDLQLLAQRFGCVRIYSVNNGLAAVPGIAREVGLRVLLGLWIGPDPVMNQREIARGLQVAAADHDVIDAVIVGNEVLLRRELTADKLAALVRQVNDATDLPVTYADVWDFWRTNPAMAEVTDFITVHVLPYWENKPTGIEGALAEAASMYGEATVTFPGRRIFIGETGWPSQGRQREDAKPSTVGQARFIREFTRWAHDNSIHYNLIEAFDQPWKRGQEGTVGGYWGLYDKDGRAKFPLQGPLQEDAMWHQGPIDAVLCALLFTGLGLLLRRSARSCDLLLMAATGAVVGPLLPLQWHYIADTSRNFQEAILGGTTVIVGNVLALWLLLVAAGLKTRQQAAIPDAIGQMLRDFNRHALPPRAEQGHSRVLGLLRLALLVGLTYVCLGLALDARYRGFPLPLYVLPLTIISALALSESQAWRLRWRQMPEEAGLTLLCGVCAVVWALREGPLNPASLTLSGLVVLFSLSQLISRNSQSAGQHQ